MNFKVLYYLYVCMYINLFLIVSYLFLGGLEYFFILIYFQTSKMAGIVHITSICLLPRSPVHGFFTFCPICSIICLYVSSLSFLLVYVHAVFCSFSLSLAFSFSISQNCEILSGCFNLLNLWQLLAQ